MKTELYDLSKIDKLYNFFVYINIHNKVKSLKSELSLNIYDLDLEKTKVILDTEFIQEKNKIVKRYSLKEELESSAQYMEERNVNNLK